MSNEVVGRFRDELNRVGRWREVRFLFCVWLLTLVLSAETCLACLH